MVVENQHLRALKWIFRPIWPLMGVLCILTLSSHLLAQQGQSVGVYRLHKELLDRLERQGGMAKAWVFFADKGFSSNDARESAINKLTQSYNPRAIQRRTLRGDRLKRSGAIFDTHDLNVSVNYIKAVKQSGVRVHIVSRWLNAVSIYGTQEQLETISTLQFVDRLEPVGRSKRIEPIDISQPPQETIPAISQEESYLDYGLARGQLEQINLIELHEAGFTGNAVVIGILDTGFQLSHEAFNYPGHPLKVIAEYDFINNDPNVGIEPGDPFSQHSHGTRVLSVLGGYKPGSLIGGAYDASFILCKTEDTQGEYPGEEDNFVAGLEFIEANGGDVATSSLAYIDWYSQNDLDGQTAVTTIAINIATDNGMHCCNAAGNAGHDSDPTVSHLLAPADAFDVITCGAVYPSGGIVGFSSDGPTADGRVKPELLAQGAFASMVSPYSDTGYISGNGTSFATPLVASAVACLVEMHPRWGVGKMRTRLFKTADYYMEFSTYDPQYVRGYGIVDAYGAGDDDKGNKPTKWGTVDMDNDNDVDMSDYNIFTGQWLNNSCKRLNNWCNGADINGDRRVDVADLIELGSHWLESWE